MKRTTEAILTMHVLISALDHTTLDKHQRAASAWTKGCVSQPDRRNSMCCCKTISMTRFAKECHLENIQLACYGLQMHGRLAPQHANLLNLLKTRQNSILL